MAKQTYPLGGNTRTETTIYGTGSTGFSSSGSSNESKTTNWRIHIQNVEIMYKRVTQYATLDGSPDFNYLDCAYTIECAREHIYLNASAGDMTQLQQLDLIGDDSSYGALGSSGVIRTQVAGVTRREVMDGDVESRTRANGTLVAGKQPGLYVSGFDSSANTNSTVLDMLVVAKADCPTFELNLLDL